MKALKSRLLLASPDLSCFEAYLPSLKSQFDTQTANSNEMTQFLCDQWEPHILIVHFDTDLRGVVTPIRANHRRSNLGIVALLKDPSLLKEGEAFNKGCDYVLAFSSDPRPLNWRLQALISRLNCHQTQTNLDTNSTDSTLNITESPPQNPVIELGALRIYPRTFLVKRHDLPLSISPTQFNLLLTFLSHQDQLLSRDWLKAKLWSHSPISSRSIDAQISKLKKLMPELEGLLINVYGKGYILSSTSTQAA